MKNDKSHRLVSVRASLYAVDIDRGFSIQAMDGMQKAVAKNMEATLDVPVFRVSRKIRTDAFDDLYRQLKPKGVTVSHPRRQLRRWVYSDRPPLPPPPMVLCV